jgi:hypothetical protein
MLLEVLMNLETIILEGNKKPISSNNLPFSSVFSRAILEITELVVTLTELYLKARLVVQLVFSFLPRLLKITGQFRMIVPIGLLPLLSTFFLYMNVNKLWI